MVRKTDSNWQKYTPNIEEYKMKYITSEIKIKNSNIQQPYLNIKSFSSASATIKEV